MNPEITMLWVHAGSIGYGRYGEELARQLREIPVDIYDHIEDPTADPSMAHLNEGRKAKRTNVVAWISVPTHARGWHEGQHTVISTMWEATVLPESFREALHNFDQVIVPSHQNVELFSKYHDNVTFVPLGVDPDKWRFQARKAPGREFRFLIGGSGPRKGTDLAFEAFRKVFATWPSDMPVPTLVMKNPRGEDFYGDRVQMISGRISAQAEVDLYASAHCYIQPSRGEGFGLQPLQAIAQGCPTILTAAHGHDSFAHLGYGISAREDKAAYFMYGDAGDWWEPDFDELCERMEWVYHHYTHAVTQAADWSRQALSEFTWRRTAERFVDAIGLDRLAAPYRGSGEWVAPDIKKYLVRVTRPWRADIGGASYEFKPDTDYWEVADTKRVLFETGVLDPSCVGEVTIDGENLESGLTDEQVARIGGYSAAHEYCERCGQKLGSGVTRADEIELQLNAGAIA